MNFKLIKAALSLALAHTALFFLIKANPAFGQQIDIPGGNSSMKCHSPATPELDTPDDPESWWLPEGDGKHGPPKSKYDFDTDTILDMDDNYLRDLEHSEEFMEGLRKADELGLNVLVSVIDQAFEGYNFPYVHVDTYGLTVDRNGHLRFRGQFGLHPEAYALGGIASTSRSQTVREKNSNFPYNYHVQDIKVLDDNALLEFIKSMNKERNIATWTDGDSPLSLIDTVPFINGYCPYLGDCKLANEYIWHDFMFNPKIKYDDEGIMTAPPDPSPDCD